MAGAKKKGPVKKRKMRGGFRVGAKKKGPVKRRGR